MFNLRPVAVGISAFLYGAMTFNTALADDTEIYVPRDLPADQQVRPNIMFILDSSGSMDSIVPNTGNKTRTQVMRQVVNNLIDDLKTKEDVNIGFMRFRGTSNEQGGRVVSPVQRLTTSNAETMKTVVNGIPAEDWTPLSETYYEAYLYMAGKTPFWGVNSSVSSSKSGGKYISPISHACQKSHIIYVTDGEPTRDVDSNTAIRSLANVNSTYTSTTCGTGHGQCLPHLAEYMANQDLFPAPAPFSDPTNRKQTVTSHFVGFAIDLPLLKNAATAGGGRYYTSDNVSGLTDALKAIIVDITAENTSFAAPSVAVSAFNNLGFRNDLYYALFRPAEGANWPGNVKRYKLGKDTAGNPLIVDQSNNAAIDDSTGFFSNSASSFWSSTPDGSDVSKGGVAGLLLNPDTRKIFTWTGADRTATASTGVTGSVSLNATNYLLTTTNSLLTNTMLGASNDTQKNQFINWARGKNTDSTNRLAISDVLHNEPKLVAYTTDEDLARVSDAPLTSPEQLYMFFGSNEGFIHAIDPKTGNEKFAFIPKELLPNPGAYLTNAKGSSNKKYGMDGQINLWTQYRTQTSADITAKTRVIEKAYLYAGMRRGGSNYYALDVSSINAPAFKWMIKGAYNTTPTPGFEKLGLTFSAPKLADVKINGAQTKVLIFTGGYDRNHDTVGTNVPKADSIGNALFIADAETGKLLWRAGGSSDTGANLQIASMTNSMPADPTIVDINGDGLADIIYASDLRGQVFRFDINNANTGIGTGTAAFATGGRIAQLGGTTAADNRRFFGAPDVALIRERGGKTYFTISIGSGFRESPLNTDTNDRFYVLRDGNVFNTPTSYVTITEDDLTNVTGFDLSAGDTAAILETIRTLEAQMLALNNTVDDARLNFSNYRASIGHTSTQNAASQALSDANERQKQMDQIFGDDPYILENNENLQQQSKLQSSLEKAQIALTKLQQLYMDADSTDVDALKDRRDKLASEYARLTELQSNLDTEYAPIKAQEALIASKKAEPNFNDDELPDLEDELAVLRADYLDNNIQDLSIRAALNEESPTKLDKFLASIQAALALKKPVPDIITALDDAWTDSAAVIAPLNAKFPGTEIYTDLLNRDETAKASELKEKATNSQTIIDQLALLETERNALITSGAALQAEADVLAALPYNPASALLSAAQLTALQAQTAPKEPTIFDAYQFLIDQALARTADPEAGLPYLRKEIDKEYAKLTPGNNYTPNTELLAASKGFYLKLPKGEKVLSSSISFRGAVLFSTFSPRGQAVSTCGSDVGRGRTYALNLIDASALFTETAADGTKKPVRSFDLKRSGIPPTPSVILSEGKPTILTGTEILRNECVDGAEICRAGDAVKATYWREN